MWTIRDAEPGEIPEAFDIWRRAVAATHGFVAPQDLAEIELMVREFLPEVPVTLAVDETGRIAGFMVVSEGHLEALFIDPPLAGQGAGRALVGHATARFTELVSEVNEQNTGAVAFYRRLGFKVTGRSPRDDQGRPYPLLQIRLDAPCGGEG